MPNLIVPDFFAMKVRIDLSHCSLAVIGLTLCAIVLQFHAENCKYFQKQHKSPKIHTCTLSIFYSQSHSMHSPVSKDLLYFCNGITNWTVIQSHISNLTQKIIIFEQGYSILYIHSLSQFIRGWVDPLLMQSQFSSMHGAIGLNVWIYENEF